MRKEQMRLSDPAEAAVLDQITVRLIRSDEQERWNQLVSQHHYLKNSNIVGEQLRYVAEHEDQWLPLLGCSAAAYHIRARDQCISGDDHHMRTHPTLVDHTTRSSSYA